MTKLSGEEAGEEDEDDDEEDAEEEEDEEEEEEEVEEEEEKKEEEDGERGTGRDGARVKSGSDGSVNTTGCGGGRGVREVRLRLGIGEGGRTVQADRMAERSEEVREAMGVVGEYTCSGGE
jgi:hypothetical protein